MKKDVLDKLTILVTSAFGLVAALAWNDTVRAVFARFSDQNGIFGMITYATIVTIVAVLVTVYVGRLSSKN